METHHLLATIQPLTFLWVGGSAGLTADVVGDMPSKEGSLHRSLMPPPIEQPLQQAPPAQLPSVLDVANEVFLAIIVSDGDNMQVRAAAVCSFSPRAF
jgi:hypothetical protein